MKKIFAVAVALTTATPALANETGSDVFVEFGAGASFGHTDLKHYNPDAVAQASPSASAFISGDHIILKNPDNSSSSFTGYANVGYNLSKSLSISAEYAYLGKFKSHGFSDFGVLFQQDINSSAHALMVKMGARTNLTDTLAAELNGGIGASFIKSAGAQGANLGPQPSFEFPSASHTNFAWTLGAGLSQKLSENTTLVGRVNYYSLGKADTGMFTGYGPTHPERLDTDLSATTATIGIRFAL